MNRIMHELYTFEDKTSDEVLLINGFQHINQLIPYINDLQQENKSLKEENKKLKQWDCNKDSRNSRQRVANAKLIKENQKYKEVIDKTIEELKKGLHELEIRRREEVYIEQYIEQSIDILKEVE